MYIYRPPTKLGEGDVFTGICQSFCPQGVGISGSMSFLGVGISGTRSFLKALVSLVPGALPGGGVGMSREWVYPGVGMSGRMSMSGGGG